MRLDCAAAPVSYCVLISLGLFPPTYLLIGCQQYIEKCLSLVYVPLSWTPDMKLARHR